MTENRENVVNMREWEAARAQRLFGEIATEIRGGELQRHFVDNTFLFAKTDEILYFALAGEKFVLDEPDYQEKRAAAAQEILKNADGIVEALFQYPKNDCIAVRESIEKIRELAQQIMAR